ncbi:MAG: carbohydrate ABC transporter permease [Thermomicrobiales bacterium]
MSSTRANTLIQSDVHAKRTRVPLGKILLYAMTIAFGFLFALPFLWMLSTAFKSRAELNLFPPSITPIHWTPSNFAKIWSVQPFARFLINSGLYAGGAVIGTVLSSTLVAYGFARLKFWGRNVWFVVLLATLMLPSQVLFIPQYILFRDLGWLNSLKPLVVPTFFGNPFYIFLIRQFLRTLPRSLDEAALLDGATQWQVFTRIILPLCRPILVTVAAFTFVAHWNDYLGPLIYLRDPSRMTAAVGILLFRGDQETLVSWVMAAAVITVIPVVLVFLWTQKYYVQGIATTGGKE